jgi:type II secretory pathway pseudopilin PulG
VLDPGAGVAGLADEPPGGLARDDLGPRYTVTWHMYDARDGFDIRQDLYPEAPGGAVVHTEGGQPADPYSPETTGGWLRSPGDPAATLARLGVVLDPPPAAASAGSATASDPGPGLGGAAVALVVAGALAAVVAVAAVRRRRRWVGAAAAGVALALVAVASAGPASAKGGPTEVAVTFPGGIRTVTITPSDHGGSLSALVDDLGLWDTGGTAEPPAGSLGPRFTVTWTMAAGDPAGDVVQSLYPEAAGGPLVHTGTGGWRRADPSLEATFADLGFTWALWDRPEPAGAPDAASGGGSGAPAAWPLLVAAGAAVACGAVARWRVRDAATAVS